MRNQVRDILILAAIIFGFISIVLTIDYVFGQEVQNVTSPPAPAPQELNKVVEEVPALVEQVDTNSATTTGLIGAVGTLITYAGGKFLKDRKDKGKIEEYASSTDRIVFNHVMDNYNDFATLADIEDYILDIQYTKGNENLTYKQILDTVIDTVTEETIGMRKRNHLKNIKKWNVEYYGAPSNDPSILCPDPKNKIARTMTDIKKFSVPNNVESPDSKP